MNLSVCAFNAHSRPVMVSGCANTFSLCGMSLKRNLPAHYTNCYVWKTAKGEKDMLCFLCRFLCHGLTIERRRKCNEAMATRSMSSGHCYCVFSYHIHSHKCILCLSLNSVLHNFTCFRFSLIQANQETYSCQTVIKALFSTMKADCVYLQTCALLIVCL